MCDRGGGPRRCAAGSNYSAPGKGGEGGGPSRFALLGSAVLSLRGQRAIRASGLPALLGMKGLAQMRWVPSGPAVHWLCRCGR